MDEPIVLRHTQKQYKLKNKGMLRSYYVHQNIFTRLLIYHKKREEGDEGNAFLLSFEIN